MKKTILPDEIAPTLFTAKPKGEWANSYYEYKNDDIFNHPMSDTSLEILKKDIEGTKHKRKVKDDKSQC